MTVLVLAAELDVTADHMVKTLESREVPVARFDTAWFPQQATLDAEFRDGRWVGTLSMVGRTVDLTELHAIWYRSPAAFDPPAGLSATERQWAVNEAKLGLGGVLSSLPVRWVNHPARNADASYKPLQLTTATGCGLRVPDTLVTNDAATVPRFACAPTVTKALGAPSIVEEGGRKTLFTHPLGEHDLADLRGVETTAHQFQHWVPKSHEARVIVAGDVVFAAAIRTESAEAFVDWRNDYNALRYERVEPPAEVTAGVLEYCVELSLLYAAFDFVITPDGDWVFLECNPGGQYGWIEDAIGAPITDAIAELLCKGATE